MYQYRRHFDQMNLMYRLHLMNQMYLKFQQHLKYHLNQIHHLFLKNLMCLIHLMYH